MKVLALVLSALILAFVSAASNIIKEDTKNNTMVKESKIIDGIKTYIEYNPWTVAVLLLNHLLCCGNLIASTVVLSSAHCLIDKNISELTIRSGSDYYNSGGQVVSVLTVTLHRRFIPHPGFYNFDIGIMFLANSAIVPGLPANIITLWNTDSVFPPGTLATVAGWGWTEASGRNGASNFLRSLEVPVVPGNACASYGRSAATFNICAGFTTGGKDPCKGDSGAGLVINNKLAGVHAFGKCGNGNVPSGYASIPKFRNWIRQHANI